MGDSSQEIHPGSVCTVPLSLAGFDDSLLRAREFFPERALADTLAEIRTHTYPRRELCAILETTASQLNAPEESLRNIRALSDENTFVVVTGQQAGFLGGPLYTLYKALSAIALARRYERETGARFVPVFWVAGDDHDIDEVDHAYGLLTWGRALFNARSAEELDHAYNFADFRIQELRLEIQFSDRGRDASKLQVSLGQALYDRLIAVVPDAAAYEIETLYNNNSLESSFAALLLRWLGKQGLVVALSSSMRRLATPVLQRNLADFAQVEQLIGSAGERMIVQGFKPGFPQSNVAPHVFHHDLNGKRVRVVANSVSVEDLAATPQQFSAGAALRPIVQQTVFPVAAAVLGPGEIRYWAQLREAHAHYGAVWPLIVPRMSLTILDDHCEKAVRKLKIERDPCAIFRTETEWQNYLAARSEVAKKIETHAATMLRDFDRMIAEFPQDIWLTCMSADTRKAFDYRFKRLARSAALYADETGRATLNRVRILLNHIRPRNIPQERFFCCAQFLENIPQLPEFLLEHIDPLSARHHIVTLP